MEGENLVVAREDLSENMATAKEDLIEITSEPLDLGKYIAAVRDPAAGAIATFSGTTRDTFDGRRVFRLEYEAYAPMASSVLRSICQSARRRWSLAALAVAHRTGVVPVGDESVFVAASSVHRADALEACRFIIDEIKASVPIWKKEIYADGEVWKENKEFFSHRDEMVKGNSCLHGDVLEAHTGTLGRGCCNGPRISESE